MKTVQAALGHSSAVETLETYTGLWPDAEQRTRAAVDGLGLIDRVTGGQTISAPPLRLDDGPGRPHGHLPATRMRTTCASAAGSRDAQDGNSRCTGQARRRQHVRQRRRFFGGVGLDGLSLCTAARSQPVGGSAQPRRLGEAARGEDASAQSTSPLRAVSDVPAGSWCHFSEHRTRAAGSTRGLTRPLSSCHPPHAGLASCHQGRLEDTAARHRRATSPRGAGRGAWSDHLTRLPRGVESPALGDG